MFDQAILRTGIKYGVICALVTFAVVLLLYFSGRNPYGKLSTYSLIFVPFFVFAALRYFKKIIQDDFGFLKAFRVALSTTFYAALCSAMLLFIFAVIVGLEPIQVHIAELKSILDENRAAALEAKVFTETAYAQFYKEVEKTTPSILAADDFMKKFGIGFLSSIVGAVLYRK